MDVDTEVSFPSMASRREHSFPCVKRPRTDETSQHQHPANSPDGFHEDRSENSLFCKGTDQQEVNFSSPSPDSRRFLTIRASGLIFESENFRPKGETLYTPLKEDVIVNTRNIEQFTFTNGSFFIGDESSRFSRTVQGVGLNLWRFENQTKKLFISRSFVFSNPQEAQEFKGILETM